MIYLLDRAETIVIGPGLSRSDNCQKMAAEFAERAKLLKKHVIFDGVYILLNYRTVYFWLKINQVL